MCISNGKMQQKAERRRLKMDCQNIKIDRFDIKPRIELE